MNVNKGFHGSRYLTLSEMKKVADMERLINQLKDYFEKGEISPLAFETMLKDIDRLSTR